MSNYTKGKGKYLRASVFTRIHFADTSDYHGFSCRARVRYGLTKGPANAVNLLFKLKQKEGRAVRAVGQHAPGGSRFFSSRLSALAIPWKRVALYVSLCVGFFLLGFLPTWIEARLAVEQRDAAQRVVRLGQLENTLATAVIDVQRGDFEPARQLTSDFYTNLRRQIDTDDTSVFTPSQRERLRSMLGERDELITLLARSDPAATDRLFHVYSTYNKLANNRG